MRKKIPGLVVPYPPHANHYTVITEQNPYSYDSYAVNKRGVLPADAAKIGDQTTFPREIGQKHFARAHTDLLSG